MDSPENEKIKSKDITKILKGIRKSKNNFKKANIFLSKEEIKNRIESSIQKINDEPSTLSTNEKIRYGKIGSSFIKGSEDYFLGFILKIKKEERKKLREKNNKFDFKVIEKEKKSFEEKKKKGKINFGIKLALFGAAFTGVAFTIKNVYDYISNNEKIINIVKELKEFLPSSLKFYTGSSKFFDGKSFSFVLTTKNGEEVPISDESFSKNPIEESAKSFDDIFLTKFLKDGFGKIVNSTEKDKSLIGYFLFKPLAVYVNRAKKYLYDAIKDPKIKKLYSDLLVPFQSSIEFINEIIGDLFGTSFNFSPLTNRYHGRFDKYILKSQDESTNIVAEMINDLKNGIFDKDKKISSFSFDGIPNPVLKFKTSTGINGRLMINVKSADKITNEIENIIKSGNTEKIFSLVNDMRKGVRINTISEYEKNNTSHLTLYNQIDGSKNVKSLLGINASGIYRTFGGDDDRMMDTIENVIIKISEYNMDIDLMLKNIAEKTLQLFAHQRLNQYYSKQDSLAKIMTKNNLDYVKQYESVHEDLIYFDKNYRTHEKLSFIVNDYFDGRWKYKNFIHKFLLMMGDNTETAYTQIHNVINSFKSSISPYSYIRETLSDVDKKDDFGNNIRDFYKKSTIIMGQSSEDKTHLEVSLTSLFNILLNYSKSKLNFRRVRLELMKRLLDKTTSTVESISVYFGPGLTS